MTHAAHSKFSASAAPRWLACAGSIALSKGKPDRKTVHAAGGTVAHTLFEHSIKGRHPVVPIALVGVEHAVDGFKITADEDMAAAVDKSLEHVWELFADADILESEARVNYADWLQVPEGDGFGTLDLAAYWIDKRHLAIGDYKHGMGVEVDAAGNEQLMLYAGAKMSELEAVGFDVDTISFYIFQPRVNDAPSEWSRTAGELREWLQTRARRGARSVLMAELSFADTAEWRETFLTPGEKQCRFCKAKASCPALRDAVVETVFDTVPATADEFEDLTAMPAAPATSAWLSTALAKVDLIEDWCKAIRAEAERVLLAGESVPGFKVVQGKRGNRRWANAEEATHLLREVFRLPVEKAFDMTLISPTTAEKLAKAGDIGPRQWPKAAAMITQSDGKPHVAPESDPRPALQIKPVADEFDDVSSPV